MKKIVTYDKTQRFTPDIYAWQITEKLDGSNLCIGVSVEGDIFIHQRNKVFCLSADTDETEALDYPGLTSWIRQNLDVLWAIHPGSVLCGEWIASGRIKYPAGTLGSPFNVFAKARYSDDNWPEINPSTLCYDLGMLHYAIDDGSDKLPDCMALVPLVAKGNVPPTMEHLDQLYAAYCETVGRPVEGFVITDVGPNHHRCKYVRQKNGKMMPHTWN